MLVQVSPSSSVDQTPDSSQLRVCESGGPRTPTRSGGAEGVDRRSAFRHPGPRPPLRVARDTGRLPGSKVRQRLCDLLSYVHVVKNGWVVDLKVDGEKSLF